MLFATMSETPPVRRAPRASLARPSAGVCEVGDKVRLEGSDLVGILRYKGPVHGREGHFAGLELIGTSQGKGKNNGTIQGYVARLTQRCVFLYGGEQRRVWAGVQTRGRAGAASERRTAPLTGGTRRVGRTARLTPTPAQERGAPADAEQAGEHTAPA